MKPIKQYFFSALEYLGFDNTSGTPNHYKKLDVSELDQEAAAEKSGVSLEDKINFFITDRISYAGADLRHIKEHKQAISTLVPALQNKLILYFADQTISPRSTFEEIQKSFTKLMAHLLSAHSCKDKFIKHYNSFNSEVEKRYKEIIAEGADPFIVTQRLIKVATAFQSHKIFSHENLARPLLVGPPGSSCKTFVEQIIECNQKIQNKEEVSVFPQFYGVPTEDLEVSFSYSPIQSNSLEGTNARSISLTNTILAELISELKDKIANDDSVLAKEFGDGRMNDKILALATSKYTPLLMDKINEVTTECSPDSSTPKSEETVLTITEPAKAILTAEEHNGVVTEYEHFTAADAANIAITYEG
jgi:hypothetical protein